MSSYVVVIERGTKPNSFGAYVPDLPGCVAVAKTESDVRDRIGSAIKMHLAGMREDGVEIPAPSSTTHRVSIRRAEIQAPMHVATSPRRASAKKSSSPSPGSKSANGVYRATSKKASAKNSRKKVRR